MIRTSFRLPLALIHQLDSLAAEFRKEQIGKVTRADVLRTLIDLGLEQMEKQKKAKMAKAARAAKTLKVPRPKRR